MISYRNNFKFLVFGLLTAIFLIWFFGAIVKPFFVAAIIAYFLDPAVDKMVKMGLSRIFAIVLVMIFAIGCFGFIFSVLIPSLIRQVNLLIISLPGLLEILIVKVKTQFPVLIEQSSFFEESFNELKNKAKENSVGIANEVVSLTYALMDVVFFIFIAPVITFYLLMDWDKIVNTVDEYLPKSQQSAIRKIMREIDSVLAGFLRGQLSVCLILSCFYSFSLFLVGLEYGLLIGVFSGLISFIPFFGALFGAIIAIGFSFFQFWNEPILILIVGCVFAAGQIFEGNLLTPKLVGNAIKLHPVWLMFSLSVFGSTAGFFGLLIAVPVAAVIGVLCRSGLRRYLSSEFYRFEGNLEK